VKSLQRRGLPRYCLVATAEDVTPNLISDIEAASACAVLIDRNDLPKHLFGIPDLDLSDDLCAERLAGPWFRLGAYSTGSGRDKQGVENVVYRQSMLLSPEDFSVIADMWSPEARAVLAQSDSRPNG
jgi:hypothetical protein